MSESQERMMAIVTPANLTAFLAVCRRWDVEATVLGEVTDTGRLVVDWHGATVVDVPPRTVAHQGPVYERPIARPGDQDALATDEPSPDRLRRPQSGDEMRAAALAIAGSPNSCSKAWVTDQYDRYVLGNTVRSQPDDAGVIRIDEDTDLGIVVSTDGNGRFCRLDPYAGAQLALAEAYRNVAATGGRPLAITDCLNFGSPEDPAVMWQFAETTRGLADACRELGTPVTGGNVSFYNQTGETPILPTPVVGVLGVIDDVRRARSTGFRAAGDVIILLGVTRDELGGSAWADVVHGPLGGRPPVVDLAAERRLAEVLSAALADGLTASAHDLSDGGLSQALVECCLRRGFGARVELPGELDPFVTLFAESAARVLVSVPADAEEAFAALCRSFDQPSTRLGVVTASGDSTELEVAGQFVISLDDLRATYESTLPALFG
jgi:phosphoribosylformylglycinamidine synthase